MPTRYRSRSRGSRQRSGSRRSLKPQGNCARGFIVRKGFNRSDGTRVSSTCIKRRGSPYKAENPFGQKLRQGTLRQFGFSFSSPQEARRKALRAAVRSEGVTPIQRKLIAVANLQSNAQPEIARKARADANYVRSLRKD